MAYTTLIYEKKDNVALITLNRPECLNSFNDVAFKEIKAAVQEFELDKEARVAILRGSKRAFSAGDDIKYMTSGAITDGDDWVQLMQDCVGEISRCKKPVIAAIAGLAMGGGFELALMCDFIFAAQGTKISLPEVNVGAIPICGGIVKVAKCAGAKWAKFMCMTGERITAETAYTLGLVQKVVPYEELDGAAMETARKLAVLPTEILASVKRVADGAEDMTNERGLLYERDQQNFISRTGVGAEAAKAWVAAGSKGKKK